MIYFGKIIFAITLLFIAAVVGNRVLMIFSLKFKKKLELILVSLLIGYSLISYLIYAMGLFGYLSHLSFLLLFCSVLIFGYPSISEFKFDIIPNINRYFKFNSNLERAIIYALMLILIFSSVLNLINSLAPPSEGDSLAYHLGLPAYYLLNGKISFQPFYLTSAMPFTAEMWNLLGLRFGEGISQIFQWGINLAASLSLFLLVKTRFSKPVGFISCVLFYMLPINTFISSTGKSDSAFFAFIFMSLHFLLLYSEKKLIKYFIFSAIFTGLTLATKYQGINWALSIGIAMLYVNRYELKSFPKIYFKNVFIFVMTSLLVVSPWYLKNYYYTSDPIWPFGFELFNSKFYSQELHDKYSNWSQGPGNSIAHYFLGLWNLTLNQSAWIGGLVKPYSPYVLGFFPLFFCTWPELKREQKNGIKLIFIITIIYYSIWFNSYQQMRYAMPIMALLLIPSSFAFWNFIERGRILKYFSLIFFSLSICFCLCYSVLYNLQFSNFLFKDTSKHDFLDERVSFYKDLEWSNNNLPKEAKVFFTSLHTFYLKRNFIVPYINMGSDFESMNANDFLNFLKNEDITHVFNIGTRFESKLKKIERKNQIHKLYQNLKSTRIKSRTLGGKEFLNVTIYRIE